MSGIKCNMCKHLNLTEEWQNKLHRLTNKKYDHICKLHKVRVLHWNNDKDKSIHPCYSCGGKDFVERPEQEQINKTEMLGELELTITFLKKVFLEDWNGKHEVPRPGTKRI